MKQLPSGIYEQIINSHILEKLDTLGINTERIQYFPNF